jgi:hypothetical protein
LNLVLGDYIDVAFDKLRQREQPVAELVEATILKWNNYILKQGDWGSGE